MGQYEEYDMRDIMHTYGEYLMKLSYLYVKDWTTAEDIVQDVFIKFFEKYQQFEQRATLKTYLAKMTIHRCHDYLRSWKSRRQMFSNFLLGQIHAKGPLIDSIMIQRLEQLDLAKKVLQLPINNVK
ncbi:sigma factor [Lysinibacillus sp. NPDC097287]|uniref:sigma factor n=1 Tax=Lysinibacillus sp. NPDC097287 TaxID=3364144 RepID=UPI00381AB726